MNQQDKARTAALAALSIVNAITADDEAEYALAASAARTLLGELYKAESVNTTMNAIGRISAVMTHLDAMMP